MKVYASSFTLYLALQLIGCTADVQETEDSIKVEVEVPKVDVGNETPDTDISTDDDIDVDTPAPGNT